MHPYFNRGAFYPAQGRDSFTLRITPAIDQITQIFEADADMTGMLGQAPDQIAGADVYGGFEGKINYSLGFSRRFTIAHRRYRRLRQPCSRP